MSDDEPTSREEWQVWSFDRVAPALGAIGMSAAMEGKLDRPHLAPEASER